jgi:hypothetical protein
VQGLPSDFKSVGDLRPILLACLKVDAESKHRHSVYRAAARIDEIINYQRKG